jgi:hypothetical protein
VTGVLAACQPGRVTCDVLYIDKQPVTGALQQRASWRSYK